MYRIGQNYKLELKGKIFYTGTITDEDDTLVRIDTTRGEEIILSKGEIVQSKRIGIEDGQER